MNRTEVRVQDVTGLIFTLLGDGLAGVEHQVIITASGLFQGQVAVTHPVKVRHPQFVPLIVGQYWVSCTGSDAAEYISVTEGEVVEVFLRLSPGQGIAGRVLDADGVPSAGASIWVTSGGALNGAGLLATTDALGAFRASYARPGTYVFARGVEGQFSPGYPYIVFRDGPADIVLDRPVALEGRVVGPAGDVVSDAFVQIGWLDVRSRGEVALADGSFARKVWPHAVATRTDMSGRFRVSGMISGVQPVEVRARGCAPLRMVVDIPVGQQVRDFSLARAGRVTGLVSDAAGRALQGVVVRAQSESGAGASAVSDQKGLYECLDCPNGNIRLTARFGPVSVNHVVTLEPGATYTWMPQMGRVGRIEGSVPNWVPGSKVMIRARSGLGQAVVCSASGTFVYEGIEGALYDVWATTEGGRLLGCASSVVAGTRAVVRVAGSGVGVQLETPSGNALHGSVLLQYKNLESAWQEVGGIGGGGAFVEECMGFGRVDVCLGSAPHQRCVGEFAVGESRCVLRDWPVRHVDVRWHVVGSVSDRIEVRVLADGNRIMHREAINRQQYWMSVSLSQLRHCVQLLINGCVVCMKEVADGDGPEEVVLTGGRADVGRVILEGASAGWTSCRAAIYSESGWLVGVVVFDSAGMAAVTVRSGAYRIVGEGREGRVEVGAVWDGMRVGIGKGGG